MIDNTTDAYQHWLVFAIHMHWLPYFFKRTLIGLNRVRRWSKRQHRGAVSRSRVCEGGAAFPQHDWYIQQFIVLSGPSTAPVTP